ncbi:phage portal protein [Paenalkalicoccus suaedae]|uniref:Phage portal protein n=1 Tax=Paenalkalicoccus suaedae TaxID=2592382 RepID=A0A859FDF6_9BACI|nr:phage portal protein [Paenalkalicoccus suaedae]QKS70246.1 phage portal protein [Paenalkalicoccus suaedae]
MNFVDKMISKVAPSYALNRVVSREKLKVFNQVSSSNGYGKHGASHKKSLIGWSSRGGSAIEDIEYNVEKLRERSRDLYMGVPLATGALKTMRTNVIGSGLRLNSQIDYEYLNMTNKEADAWETKVEREFNMWARSNTCDVQRMNNFYELQQLAFLSWLMSGDAFATLPYIKRPGMPYDIRVQLFEADRVSNPNHASTIDGKIINGVEIDSKGEVIAYHFAQAHPGSSLIASNEWKRIEKYGKKTGRINVIHLMESERPEQRRGIPVLAPVIESLKQLGRYTDAELMAAVVSGMYTAFVTSKDGDPATGPLTDAISEEEQVTHDDYDYELGPGTVVHLDEGEDVTFANPGRPNQAFDGFVTSICRQVGTALEIPYEVLLKHFTSSYSASRAALLEAWKMFKMRREWLANDFCQPIYEEFLAEGIAKGRIYAPGFFTDPVIREAYCGAEWNGPSQGQLDPLKEVNAATKRVEQGFSTRTKETVELGNGEFFRNNHLRKVEEEARREAGLVAPEEDILNEGGERNEED